MKFINPLRNYLRPFNGVSFLVAIHQLSVHLEWCGTLPSYLDPANPGGLRGPMELGFFLWELDTLAREVILHCEPRAGKPVTSWNEVATAINKLKKAEEESNNEIDEYNVLAELTRIAHRQFHWQQGISHHDIIRVRKIYRSPGMNEVLLDVYGLSAEEVTLGGFAALSTFMEYFAVLPDWPEKSAEKLGFNARPVIERLTLDYDDIRKRIHEARALDSRWAYAFNPLWLHPLIRLDDGRIVCPIPGLLARRVTEGLYFDVTGAKDVLSKHMGPAFQAYIGEVLERANKGRFTVIAEEKYGPRRQPKDSVDWIVADDTATLFVEVKVLKMAKAPKEVLAPAASVTTELEKLAKGIGKVYATLSDALAGQYPHWKPNGKPVHPLIVTLDNWNLFTHSIESILSGLVFAELDRRGIDRKIVEEHHYVVCSSNELEGGIQIMNEVGIHTVMDGLTSGPKVGWLFSGHLRESFSDELSRVALLFPDERERLWPRRLDTSR